MVNNFIEGQSKAYNSQDIVGAKNSIVTDATINTAGMRNIATDTDII